MINVVYEKSTGRVIALRDDDFWMVSNDCGLATFDNGVEPILDECDDGNMYLRPNTLYITPDHLKE